MNGATAGHVADWADLPDIMGQEAEAPLQPGVAWFTAWIDVVPESASLETHDPVTIDWLEINREFS